MAWYEGTMLTNGAGELLTVLDAKLPLNANWSIYDAAAGANCKVYRNYDAGTVVDYCVKVDDNYVAYAIIELWEGWDAGAHSGLGASLITGSAGSTFRIYKAAGGWGLSLRDHRFIFCEFSNYMSNYVGQLKQFDLTKNMPIIISNNSNAGTLYNPTGTFDVGTSGTVSWRCLFDELGNVGRLLRPYGYGNSYCYIKTIVGTYMIIEYPVFNDVTKNLMGVLEGAMCMQDASSGLSSGDIVSIAGIDWICTTRGSRFSLIEKG